MFVLTLALALSPGAGDVTPYGLQPPIYPSNVPAGGTSESPYGMIFHDLPSIKPQRVIAGPPRMLPAVSVSRPTSGAKPSGPLPVTLPDVDFIPPSTRQISLSFRP
jgi:hypothetical protein